MLDHRLDRTRTGLADFLRRRRESLSPLDVGLPLGKRRRTPGLRREEVAALAGVGLTWYTWLEQGRGINVSSAFLDNISETV
ncbi:transcriptional regulator with XRE-family HTH domain [Chelatococcus caeni]|uniref:Transcriptional regulator with XRE-family HTH domain n=1 Tax=Chelatococcus caeni TaxID=1348468 RepID=A0A840C0E6_9HYPH|nr:transcriptional regulator with XRE-family HTH domain [Chelatococcus caeni]